MLEFIIGRAGTGKTTYCLDRIEEKLRQSPQGNPLVLLLPDHMTFALERQLAYNLKDVGGFSRAYVLGMSRLAYQILMRCGRAAYRYIRRQTEYEGYGGLLKQDRKYEKGGERHLCGHSGRIQGYSEPGGI